MHIDNNSNYLAQSDAAKNQSEKWNTMIAVLKDSLELEDIPQPFIQQWKTKSGYMDIKTRKLIGNDGPDTDALTYQTF